MLYDLPFDLNLSPNEYISFCNLNEMVCYQKDWTLGIVYRILEQSIRDAHCLLLGRDTRGINLQR